MVFQNMKQDDIFKIWKKKVTVLYYLGERETQTSVAQ